MFRVFINVFSPLLGLFILILGNGFFMTYVAVRLNIEGITPWLIGAMSGAYYAGLVIGSFRIEPFIVRVGHIRAYAAFASLVSALIILQAFYVNPWWWLLLRFVGGYCMAGLFITIESWLLVSGSRTTRGQILSLYMITFYAAQALGQFLLHMGNLTGLMPYLVAALLSTLSVVPLAMTRVRAPYLDQPSVLGLRALYRASPIGISGCFCSGLILGTVYGLLPVFINQVQHSVANIALLMGVTIFGGMVLQYPIGKLSDAFDRRIILLIVSLLALVICFLTLTPWIQVPGVLLALLFFFGGLTFTIYPLAISYTCDRMHQKDTVAATQGLLLAYSVGASAGPFLAPGLMHALGPQGLFIYFGIITILLTGVIVWRSMTTPAVPADERRAFTPVPRTTPVGTELSTQQKRKAAPAKSESS